MSFEEHDDDRDRLASLADCMLKRQPVALPPSTAPPLQARVRVPDSAADRRQWLQQQSKSRRQRRKSSSGVAVRQDRGGGRRSPSGSRPTSAAYGSGSRYGAFSRASFPTAEDGDSDTSSVASNLSIVSTPEISHRPRTEARRQRLQRKPGSPERPASVAGSPDRSRRSSSKGRDPSPPGRPIVVGAGAAPRSSLTRKSSSPALSASVSSSLSLRWCGVCEAEFTRLRRPHRCRRCLEAVCAPCSPARLPVPGTASLELKRTCKLCAEESARLERRADDAAAYASRPATAAGGSSRTHWRTASVGDLTRAPLEMISGVAAAVSAGLYPAAPPADGAEDGGGGKAGGSDGRDSSLRARLAAGGLAALGAVGAGFGLSGERQPGEVGSEADGNVGKEPTLRQIGGLFGSGKANAETQSTVIALSHGEAALSEASGDGTAKTDAGDRLPEASGVGKHAARVTARLAAGGIGAWGKLGAGLSGDVPWRDVGASMLPVGVLSRGAGAGDGDDAKKPAAGADTEAAAADGSAAEASPARVDELLERDGVPAAMPPDTAEGGVGSPPTEPAVGAAAATGAAEGAVLSDRRPGGLDEPTPSAPDDEAPASASEDASEAGALPDSGEASPGAEQGHGSAAPAVEARARADLKGSAVARAGTTEHATAVAAAELVQDAAAVPMEESAAGVVDGDNPVGADATLLKVDEATAAEIQTLVTPKDVLAGSGAEESAPAAVHVLLPPPPPPAADEPVPQADAFAVSALATTNTSASGASVAATTATAETAETAETAARVRTAPAEEMSALAAAAAPGAGEEKDEEEDGEGGEKAIDAAVDASAGGDADLPQISGEGQKPREPHVASLPGPPVLRGEAPEVDRDATAVISAGSGDGSPAGLHTDSAVVDATTLNSTPAKPAGSGAVVASDAARLNLAAGHGAHEMNQVGQAAAVMPGVEEAGAQFEASKVASAANVPVAGEGVVVGEVVDEAYAAATGGEPSPVTATDAQKLGEEAAGNVLLRGMEAEAAVEAAAAPAAEQPDSVPLEDESGKVPATNPGAAGATQDSPLVGEEVGGESKADEGTGREAEGPAPASVMIDRLPSAAKPDETATTPVVGDTTPVEGSSPLAEEAIVVEQAPPLASASASAAVEDIFAPSTPELDELLPSVTVSGEEAAKTRVGHTAEDMPAAAIVAIAAATKEVASGALEVEGVPNGAVVTQESTALEDEVEHAGGAPDGTASADRAPTQSAPTQAADRAVPTLSEEGTSTASFDQVVPAEPAAAPSPVLGTNSPTVSGERLAAPGPEEDPAGGVVDLVASSSAGRGDEQRATKNEAGSVPPAAGGLDVGETETVVTTAAEESSGLVADDGPLASSAATSGVETSSCEDTAASDSSAAKGGEEYILVATDNKPSAQEIDAPIVAVAATKAEPSVPAAAGEGQQQDDGGVPAERADSPSTAILSEPERVTESGPGVSTGGAKDAEEARAAKKICALELTDKSVDPTAVGTLPCVEAAAAMEPRSGSRSSTVAVGEVQKVEGGAGLAVDNESTAEVCGPATQEVVAAAPLDPREPERVHERAAPVTVWSRFKPGGETIHVAASLLYLVLFYQFIAGLRSLEG